MKSKPKVKVDRLSYKEDELSVSTDIDNDSAAASPDAYLYKKPKYDLPNLKFTRPDKVSRFNTTKGYENVMKVLKRKS